VERADLIVTVELEVEDILGGLLAVTPSQTQWVVAVVEVGTSILRLC
jgi:hypothetical protein